MYFQSMSKVYKASNDLKLSYLLKKKKANDTLVVIFSAYPRTGMPATYNYVNTLKSIQTDQLFILDNFGNEKLGAFYLYENGTAHLEEAVTSLLQKQMSEKKYKKIIFVGTSKGGFAATYYGLKLGADIVISGAQQYYLGNYLTDNEGKKATLTGMVGDSKKLTVDHLNSLISTRIQKQETPLIKFYIHYSDQEHTYPEHITFLLRDLKQFRYQVVENRERYVRHQEVAQFFPKFLYDTLQTIIQKKQIEENK